MSILISTGPQPLRTTPLPLRAAHGARPTTAPDDRLATSANGVYCARRHDIGRRAPGAEPAMRINRLDINNFRCFDERSFTFHERFTLLVGANATGKTAVLDALAVALGAALIPVPHALSGSIHHRDVRRTYQQIGETGHFREHYPARIEAHGSIEKHSVIWTRALRSAKSRTTRGGSRAIREAMNQLVQGSASHDDVLLPYIGYYGTGRLWREQRLLSEGGIDPARRSSRYVGYQNCLTRARRLDTSRPGSSASPSSRLGEAPSQLSRPSFVLLPIASKKLSPPISISRRTISSSSSRPTGFRFVH